MELIHSLLPINLFTPFFVKFSLVLFLFILNIYLIITYKKEESDNSDKILQSGFRLQNLKGVLGNLVTIGGFLSIYITIKNELKDIQIGRLDHLQMEERTEIRRSIDKDKEEHRRLLDSLEENREELNKLHVEKAKIFAHNDRILTLHNSIKNNIVSYRDKSSCAATQLLDYLN